MKNRKKIALIILDGWGIAQTWAGNAIGLANTPTMDTIAKEFPYSTLEASGNVVGLPFDEPGNSEVGHLNIGAGRIAQQGLTAINQMIEDKTFFKNDVLREGIERTVFNKRKLHFVGLVSDGGIHSHIRHLFALLALAKTYKAERVYVHVITDGRDSAPTSAISFIDKLEDQMKEIGVGKIASVSGRYFAMDRDKHWDRLKRSFDVMVLGEGSRAESAKEVLAKSYAEGITDEYITPTLIDKDGQISNEDSVIFFNFRSDRIRQLIDSIGNKKFTGFESSKVPKDVFLASFASYQEGVQLKLPFESREISNPLASVFAQHQISHLHAAETEKYAHVTYFFNGGKEPPFEHETRIFVPSPNVATYDLKPEMSAAEIVQKVIPHIGKTDFSVINFANADMVGHTGNFEAAIKAVNTVDRCLNKVLKEVVNTGGLALVTADHGNAEQMINPLTGMEDTEHTTNLVPFAIVGKDVNKYKTLLEDGRLSDIAPTILEIMEIDKPKEMVGRVLFK